MVTHAKVNLLNTVFKSAMVQQFARIVPTHVNVLCECDVEFAREHVLQIKVLDDKYIHSRGPDSQWDPASADFICPHGEASVYVPKCCAPADGTGVARLYNAASKACCSNGRVVTDVSQC